MTRAQFTRDSHYVPRIYLKQWASGEGRLWTYRLLVSHANVPVWKPFSTRGIACRAHLYTRIIAGGETDDIEKWLDRDFETPAEPVIKKIVSENRLSPNDWELLMRFLAAQDVRTPSRMSECLVRWRRSLPDLLQRTLDDSVHELEAAKREGRPIRQPQCPDGEPIPFQVTTGRDTEAHRAFIKAESVVGRGLWLHSLKHLLTNTIKALLGHRWTILKPPEGIHWITSDDPVVKLNYFHPWEYDFKGGWGSKGTEILFPISPNHLVYTKIGEKPPPRGTIVQPNIAEMFQRFSAEHAHRFIFAVEVDTRVERIRPRTVNGALYQEEANQWKDWHEQNARAERKLMNHKN